MQTDRALEWYNALEDLIQNLNEIADMIQPLTTRFHTLEDEKNIFPLVEKRLEKLNVNWLFLTQK